MSVPIRAAIYARVSSRPQDDESRGKTSIGDQVKACRETISQKKWQEATEPYKDVQSGQSIDGRVDFKRMLSDADRGRFNLIVVWDYNRFARNANESSLVQERLLRERGIQVYSLAQPVEPDPPDKIDFRRDDRIIVQKFSEMTSEIQINEMVRKFKRGMESKVRNGVIAKPRNKVFGYKVDMEVIGNSEVRYFIVPEPEQSKVVAQIFSWSVSAHGDRKIAEMLNETGVPTLRGSKWHSNTVRGVLINPIYCGKTVWHKSKVVGHKKNGDGKLIGVRKLMPREKWLIANSDHEAIVSEETFEKASQKRQQRRKIQKASYSKALLVGLLKCRVHGCGMVAHIRPEGYKKGISKYSCGHKHAGKVKSCPNAEVRMDRVDDAVIGKIVKMIDDKKVLEGYIREQLDAEIADTERTVAELKNQQREQEKKVERLFEAYEKGIINIDEFSKRKIAIFEESQQREILLDIKEKQLEDRSQFRVNYGKAKKIRGYYANLKNNREKLRDLLFAVIDHIDVMQTGDPKKRDYEINIYFSFDG